MGIELVNRHSVMLDHFLALHRETGGRFAQERTYLPWPLDAAPAGFRDGIAAWSNAGLNELPRWIADAGDIEELRLAGGHPDLAPGTELVAAALKWSWEPIDDALSGFRSLRDEAEAELHDVCADRQMLGAFFDALGIVSTVHLELYPVILAPHYPGAGFLTDDGRLAAAYLDVNRLRGLLRDDALLSVAAWSYFRGRTDAVLPADHHTSRDVDRRIRALAAKCIIELSAASAVRLRDPSHRGAVDLLGTAWRHPRLYAAVEQAWTPVLTGSTPRDQAARNLLRRLRSCSDDWWLLDLDGASIAADFYLLEHLATTDVAAAQLFARWLPMITSYLAGQIDVIIGTELGHFERALGDGPVFSFVADVNTGDSRAGWYDARRRLGQRDALEMAQRVFEDLGAGYGGDSWAQPTRLLRAFVTHEISPTVFADQCFTLEHNNGALFDKYWDTCEFPTVLDAHAAGDVELLAGFASAAVQDLWLAHQSSRWDPNVPASLQPLDGVEDPTERPAGSASFPRPPGPAAREMVGCGWSGSRVHRPRKADRAVDAGPPAARPGLPCSLTFATTLGGITIRLRKTEAPVNVAAFVDLATGERAWTDPTTWERRRAPFYTHTVFYRCVTDEIIQAGDHTGTGEHGPGFRVADEYLGHGSFDMPYVVGMNNHGPDTAGSQFFITIPPRPHLDRRHTAIGTVDDESSRGVVTAISRSATPVAITGVIVH
ncbi:MAG: peptidylprolyl isomerase [Acidimicrobiales bacterium]